MLFLHSLLEVRMGNLVEVERRQEDGALAVFRNQADLPSEFFGDHLRNREAEPYAFRIDTAGALKSAE